MTKELIIKLKIMTFKARQKLIAFVKPMKVDFVIAGAQKSGTTALYKFLSQNSKIEMSQIKETGFFYKEEYWQNGVDYKHYHDCFKQSLSVKIYGEASPTYMLLSKKVAPRIFEYNPKMKLIFILRNPIERVFSQYTMMVKKNDIKYTFQEFLNIAITTVVIKNCLKLGHYSEQINDFKNLFPQDQILILLQEDLMENHQDTLNKIFDFLETPRELVTHEIVHSFQNSTLPEEQRLYLLKEYENEITEIESLLDRNLSHWRN
jgi:hypothetical protein